MRSLPRLLLGIVLGFLVGSLVNMALIRLGHVVVPPPAGLDPSDIEALKVAMASFGPRQFIFPWLAHASGTLAGAWLACRMASGWRWKPAAAVGVLFFLGGLLMVGMVPAPRWFVVADLVGAYAPFAWLGYRLAQGGKHSGAT